MSPVPPADDEVRWELRNITGGFLPPDLRELEIIRHENLLRAIKAIDKPEAQTSANIQKFSFTLQKQGLKEIGPTEIHRGGRWDSLRNQELQNLLEHSLVERRRSRMRGVDASVYEIASEYRDKIEVPKFFKDAFQKYKSVHKGNFRDPFHNHDRNVILEWALDPDNFISFDRERFEQVRHDDLDVDVKIIPEKLGNLSSQVREMNRVYRPFTATIDYMVREYKFIHSPKARKERPEEYKRSGRMFDLREASRQYNQHPSKVIGDLGLYVGILGAESLVSGNNYWELWKNPKFDHSVLADFDKEETVQPHEISECSVGLLGYLDDDGYELVLRVLAILESDDLSSEIIDYQRHRTLLSSNENHSGRIDDAIRQLHKEIEVIEGEKRKYPRRLMKQLHNATTIATAIKYLEEFKEEHPGMAWMADKAMKHINT